MKKNIILVILFLMFIPFMVNAETCNPDSISISSIEMDSKSENVTEVNTATVNGKNINLDLKLSEVGDNIQYKITVKNTSNEDYVLDNNSFDLGSNYIDYSIITEDNSDIVKANSTKTVMLMIKYNNEVPSELLENGTYVDEQTGNINLSSEDNIVNPKTGVQSYIYLFIALLVISITIYLILKKNKYSKMMVFITGLIIFVPISVYALCKCEIKIKSRVEIESQSNSVYTIGYYTRINQKISNDITIFKDAQSAMMAWNDLTYDNKTRPFYLKHILNDNKEIMESYVEFEISDAMANTNVGLRPGKYAIRGGVSEENADSKPISDYNKSVLLSAFGNDYCDIYDWGTTCSVQGLSVYYSTTGSIEVDDNDSMCTDTETGDTGCNGCQILGSDFFGDSLGKSYCQ